MTAATHTTDITQKHNGVKQSAAEETGVG